MAELIEKLGINWKIFLAQVVNFVILLFVLKKIAFDPFLKTLEERNKKVKEIEDREKEIEERLKNLEAKEKEVLERAKKNPLI